MSDPTEARGKEVDEESELSISTSSLTPGISPHSHEDGGDFGDDEPAMYGTVEHFPSAIDLDPHHGYVRYVP